MSLVAAVARARAALNLPPGAPGRPAWNRGASEITPQLYLSDLWTACDAEEIEKLGITHIVSVIEHRPALPDSVPLARRHQIFIADRGDANILVHFEESTKFIREAVEGEGNKVLVHCQQGISRSATIVCAYLCATQGLDAVDAVEYVQARRTIVCPNAGFRVQLAKYARPFVHANYKPKVATVSGDIASRIRRLFPDKAVKRTPSQATVVVVENAGADKSEAEVLVDEAVERAFGTAP